MVLKRCLNAQLSQPFVAINEGSKSKSLLAATHGPHPFHDDGVWYPIEAAWKN
jgi:hypothetical protein